MSDFYYGLDVTDPLRPQVLFRLDSATLVHAPPALTDNYSLAQASLRWSNRTFDISVGDAYVSFGNGLGLSLRKLDEFGVDTTLRGAKVVGSHSMSSSRPVRRM